MLYHRPPSSWLTLAFAFLIVACQAAPTASPGQAAATPSSGPSGTSQPGPGVTTATPFVVGQTGTVPALSAATTVLPTATEAAASSTATVEPTAIPPTATGAAAVSTATEESTAVPPTATEAVATPSEVITQAVMADDTTCDLKDPGGISDTFPAAQSIFHAVVTIANAPTDTQVKVEWMVVDDGNPSDANSKVTEFELTADGSRNLDFTFEPNSGSLPPGQYRADVYLNGVLNQSLDFSVAPEKPTPTVSDVIADAVMAKDSTCNKMDAVGITDSFPAGQSVFHAVVALSDAPQGTRVQVAWTVIDDGRPSDANTKMGEYEITSDGSRNLDFTFKPDSGRLPPGQYRADVYLNGKLFKSLDFTVSGS